MHHHRNGVFPTRLLRGNRVNVLPIGSNHGSLLVIEIDFDFGDIRAEVAPGNEHLGRHPTRIGLKAGDHYRLIGIVVLPPKFIGFLRIARGKNNRQRETDDTQLLLSSHIVTIYKSYAYIKIDIAVLSHTFRLMNRMIQEMQELLQMYALIFYKKTAGVFFPYFNMI